ncbi:MAG TPA: HAD-IA family hydrolase [Polyangiales bacterium]|nr:HAD-IA family hydrolase [Polyangiales bacterium]
MEPRGLLLDLDDTLYAFAPVEARARAAIYAEISRDLSLPETRAKELYEAARSRVMERLGTRASAHSRLLFLHELVASVGAPLVLARKWERTFWGTSLTAMTPYPEARPLLEAWRAAGNRTAIVTDLMLSIQFDKLDRLGLLDLVDAVIASEEVPWDKPAPEIFELAWTRLGVPRERCVMVGDNDARDGEGARALGIPFLHVRGSDRDAPGMPLSEVVRALGLHT